MTAQARVPPNHLIPDSATFDSRVLERLAAEFGTPVFVYDFELLTAAAEELRGFLPNGSRILYSVKANPSLAILRHLADLGTGFEVASTGELRALERAGIDLGSAIFVGPGKRPAEVAEAVERGLGWLVMDSALEYVRAAAAEPVAGRRPSLAVRLNPGLSGSRSGVLHMAGPTPFGITEPEALDLLRAASQPIEGFHGYLGTHFLDADTILTNTALLLDVAERLQKQTSTRFRFVDLGGGFGIPQYDRDVGLDGPRLRAGLQRLVDDFRRSHPWTEVIAFESGRFLTARSGVLLCSVVDCKERDGELFVVLDGGVNAVGGRDGYAGARPMPLRLLADGDQTVSATFCGPLCTPMDRLAARVLTPRPQPGQVVALFLAGAYAYSASPGLFLSHGYCAEVGVSQGHARLLRPRQDIDALLDSQRM
jgi:diaminopimelate decarboxylase